ncbi:MAG TPA: hypothetical protein VMM18_13870 [Gemmatimonadaceae bacterium]|nr:hypothetical protein [Gemmatimonadaceae bacterium]
MTWKPRDCHAHTTMSDGELGVAELVEIVQSRGVLPSVADHISRSTRTTLSSVAAVRRYLDELDQYPVARAGEFCWHDSLWREIPPDLVRRFTHRIGSLHAVEIAQDEWLHAFTGVLPAGMTPASYMAAHVASLERFAREMPMDILAHPTLVPIELRKLPLEELWTEEYEERAADALFRAGIAFEVSSRYRPHERFVRRVAARGVRLSLGSDGHSRSQLGALDVPLALVRAAGVRDEDLYDPLVHGSRTGDTSEARRTA